MRRIISIALAACMLTQTAPANRSIVEPGSRGNVVSPVHQFSGSPVNSAFEEQVLAERTLSALHTLAIKLPNRITFWRWLRKKDVGYQTEEPPVPSAGQISRGEQAAFSGPQPAGPEVDNPTTIYVEDTAGGVSPELAHLALARQHPSWKIIGGKDLRNLPETSIPQIAILNPGAAAQRLRLLESINPRIRVIIMSVDSYSQEKVRVMGGDRFLSKSSFASDSPRLIQKLLEDIAANPEKVRGGPVMDPKCPYQPVSEDVAPGLADDFGKRWPEYRSRVVRDGRGRLYIIKNRTGLTRDQRQSKYLTPYKNDPWREFAAYTLSRLLNTNSCEVIIPAESARAALAAYIRDAHPDDVYLVRLSQSYRAPELPVQEARRSFTRLLIVSILMRKWDFFDGNIGTVGGSDIPMMFDGDQAFNPEVVEINDFAWLFIRNYYQFLDNSQSIQIPPFDLNDLLSRIDFEEIPRIAEDCARLNINTYAHALGGWWSAAIDKGNPFAGYIYLRQKTLRQDVAEFFGYLFREHQKAFESAGRGSELAQFRPAFTPGQVRERLGLDTNGASEALRADAPPGIKLPSISGIIVGVLLLAAAVIGAHFSHPASAQALPQLTAGGSVIPLILDAGIAFDNADARALSSIRAINPKRPVHPTLGSLWQSHCQDSFALVGNDIVKLFGLSSEDASLSDSLLGLLERTGHISLSLSGYHEPLTAFSQSWSNIITLAAISHDHSGLNPQTLPVPENIFIAHGPNPFHASILPWHTLVFTTTDGRIIIHERFLQWLEAFLGSYLPYSKRQGQISWYRPDLKKLTDYLHDVIGHEGVHLRGGSEDEALERFPHSRQIKDILSGSSSYHAAMATRVVAAGKRFWTDFHDSDKAAAAIVRERLLPDGAFVPFLDFWSASFAGRGYVLQHVDLGTGNGAYPEDVREIVSGLTPVQVYGTEIGGITILGEPAKANSEFLAWKRRQSMDFVSVNSPHPEPNSILGTLETADALLKKDGVLYLYSLYADLATQWLLSAGYCVACIPRFLFKNGPSASQFDRLEGIPLIASRQNGPALRFFYERGCPIAFLPSIVRRLAATVDDRWMYRYGHLLSGYASTALGPKELCDSIRREFLRLTSEIGDGKDNLASGFAPEHIEGIERFLNIPLLTPEFDEIPAPDNNPAAMIPGLGKCLYGLVECCGISWAAPVIPIAAAALETLGFCAVFSPHLNAPTTVVLSLAIALTFGFVLHRKVFRGTDRTPRPATLRDKLILSTLGLIFCLPFALPHFGLFAEMPLWQSALISAGLHVGWNIIAMIKNWTLAVIAEVGPVKRLRDFADWQIDFYDLMRQYHARRMQGEDMRGTALQNRLAQLQMDNGYLNWARRLCRNKGNDEGAFISTLLGALHESIQCFDPNVMDSFRHFAGIVIRRRVVDMLQEQNAHKQFPGALSLEAPVYHDKSDELKDFIAGNADTYQEAADRIVNLDELARLNGRIAAANLSDRQTQVLALYKQNQTYLEIAEALGITVKQVDNALSGIKRKLKQREDDESERGWQALARDLGVPRNALSDALLNTLCFLNDCVIRYSYGIGVPQAADDESLRKNLTAYGIFVSRKRVRDARNKSLELLKHHLQDPDLIARELDINRLKRNPFPADVWNALRPNERQYIDLRYGMGKRPVEHQPDLCVQLHLQRGTIPGLHASAVRMLKAGVTGMRRLSEDSCVPEPILQEALRTLSDDQRLVLCLTYGIGVPRLANDREIAEALQLATRVSSVRHEAIRHLRSFAVNHSRTSDAILYVRKKNKPAKFTASKILDKLRAHNERGEPLSPTLFDRTGLTQAAQRIFLTWPTALCLAGIDPAVHIMAGPIRISVFVLEHCNPQLLADLRSTGKYTENHRWLVQQNPNPARGATRKRLAEAA